MLALLCWAVLAYNLFWTLPGSVLHPLFPKIPCWGWFKVLEKHTCTGCPSFTMLFIKALLFQRGMKFLFKELAHTEPLWNPFHSLFFLYSSQLFPSFLRVISKTPLIAKYIGFVPHNVVSEAWAIALKLEIAWRVKSMRCPATLEMGKLADAGWGITYTTYILNQDESLTLIWLWHT